MALIGPGDAGPWTAERDDTEFEGGFVRRFASELAVGDIVLLRTGIATVIAVGIVASDYLYLSAFDDVNGWDLQHARRVRWGKLTDPHAFRSPIFGANPTRCSRVWNAEAIEFAERFVQSPPNEWQSSALAPLPPDEASLATPPQELRELISQAQDLIPLYQSTGGFGQDSPSEDELVAHFVVPFFRALGWPPERIGVKWRYVDVALFDALPRSPQSCRFIVEAKRLGAGVEGALTQARGYCEALGIARDLVVTDGIRYRMYAAPNFEPIAYANLARLKERASDLFDRLRRP